jgi:hypothetical protein
MPYTGRVLAVSGPAGQRVKGQDFWDYLRPQREAFQQVHVNGTNGKVASNGAVTVAAEADLEKQRI